jgi:predicted transcriptional regulator
MLKRVYLTKNGLEMFVGELEAAILRVLWARGVVLTPAQIQSALIRDTERNPAYTTVVTTVLRMKEKGLLKLVDSTKRATRYAPSVSEEEVFIDQCLNEVFSRLRTEFELTI